MILRQKFGSNRARRTVTKRLLKSVGQDDLSHSVDTSIATTMHLCSIQKPDSGLKQTGLVPLHVLAMLYTRVSPTADSPAPSSPWSLLLQYRIF